jgi:DNA polymerase-3 subunit gamma/tau
VVPLASYLAIFDKIAGNNVQGIVDDIEAVMSTGIDVPRYASGIIDLIRSLRLILHEISVQSLLGFSDDEVTQLQQVATKFHDEELSAFYRLAKQLETDLRYSTNERVNLEMALLDMLAVKKRPSLTSIVQKLDTLYTKKKNSVTSSAALPEQATVTDIKKEQPARETGFIRCSIDEARLKNTWADFLNI